jgi:hypothetical protein
MSDTPAHVSELLARRYQDRSPAERVRMAASMFRTARTLAQAGIRSEHANATEAEVRQRLLRRLYSDDLTDEQLAEVLRSGRANE